MLKFCLFLPLCLLFSSCAFLLNKPYQTIEIYTSRPAAISVDSITAKTVNNKTRIPVLRSKKDLLLHITSDTLNDSVRIPSKTSATSYLNFLTAWPLFFVEKMSPKSCAYNSPVFIDINDNRITVKNAFLGNTKGAWNWSIGVPFINDYSVVPVRQRVEKSGFLGLSLGLDYFHRKNQYFNFTLSGNITNEIPFPVGVEYFGSRNIQKMQSLTLAISDNHLFFNRLSAGYGIALHNYYWTHDIRQEDYILRSYRSWYYSKGYLSLGLNIPLSYRIGKSFHAGINYRPTLYRLGEHPAFKYEHLLSFDFIWKMPLKRYRAK